MSDLEAPQIEQRSSIKVVRNAKGEPQWEVKVVVGTTAEELDAARNIATKQYDLLKQELR